MEPKKKFWQSSNFWTAITMVIGAFFGSQFPEEAATGAINQLFLLLGSGKAIQEWLSTGPKPDIRVALSSVNFWNYLAAIGVAIIPALPGELFSRLQELAVSLIGGNWQGALVAAFSIVTILYHIFRKTPEQPAGRPMASA